MKKFHNRFKVPAPGSSAAPAQSNPLKIAHMLQTMASQKPTPKQFEPYDPPPGVIPNNLRAQSLAMDSVDYGWLNQGLGAAGVLYTSGFPGYQYLATLSQLPEYRDMSGTIAKQMTRKFIKVISRGEDDKSERIAKMEEALQKFKVQDAFRAAAELDGFFGRGQIYLDVCMPGSTTVPASIDPMELATVLLRDPAKISKGSLRGIKVIEPVWTYPSQYNSDNPLAPDYYKPTQWFVMGKTVHASRLLMFVSRPLPDMLKSAYNFGGISLTQLAEPYVNNWIRTRDSVSDMVHSYSLSGIATNLSAELAGGAADGTGMLDRATLYNMIRDNKGLFMLDKESEEFFQFNTPLSGLDALQGQAQEQMASVANIPLVYLLGITPAGLNASSDGEIKVFGEFILSMQEAIFSPNLDILFQVIQLSEFGEIDDDIGYEYEPLSQMDPVQLAAIRKQDADTDAVLINAGVIMPDEARARIASDPTAGYHGVDLNEPLPEPDLPDDENNGSPMASDANFVESDHPRDNSGKFGGGGGGATKGKQLTEKDTAHLSALQTRLSNERSRLASAKTPREKAARQAAIAMAEKEIRGERKFLGLPEEEAPLPDLDDDDLLAQLG